MKNAIIVAGTLALATASFACSSSDKAEPVDTNQALSALRSPTGSFSAKNGASIFSGYGTQRANSKKVSAPAPGGGSSTRPGSLRLLDRAADAQAACSDGQSCSCPSGGSMTYAHESSADGQLLRIDFQQCGFGDGSAFDGNAILLVSTKSILGLGEQERAPSKPGGSRGSDDEMGELEEAPETGAAGQGYAAMLLAARGTVTESGQSSPIEFALLTEASYAFLAVTVDDGHVVIGMSDDGRAIIKAKDGTWHCNPSAKGYVCKSEGGEAVDVAASASAEEGSSSGKGSPTSPAGEEEYEGEGEMG
ncbi:MAG: hypothetical protein KF819_38105 [Labilithrix sp.]|nr:hypothetical protein [Labilithrix sp.]